MIGKNISFFGSDYKESDPDVYAYLEKEFNRQQTHVELVASENIVSRAVLNSLANVTTNKYAEGYPGKRYYGGCEFVDEIEQIAIDRAKLMFECEYANVQPHSGSQANQAVFLALLQPGDAILGMSLADGGHLTHGAAPNLSGKWFKAIHYGVDEKTALIDYDKLEQLAIEHQPKLIIAGGSAYPRIIDFAKFREIADKVGAYLLADVAHYAGLIVAGEYPSPIKYADAVTTTTHKTLRGPRGGMILSNNPDLGKKFNSAIFPGLQGGPLLNIITSKAIAFGEALKPDFKIYAKQIIKNCQTMAKTLTDEGFDLVSGGTDCHLILLSLLKQNISGKDAEASLGRAGLTCNKNSIPADPKSPFITSGIRLGTPAITTRGFKEEETILVAKFISKVLHSLAKNNNNAEHISLEQEVKQEVENLCLKFPIY